MSNPLYRAECCRDLAEECRAVAALCAPSTEMRVYYSRMSGHYSKPAEAEKLADAGLRALATSTVPT